MMAHVILRGTHLGYILWPANGSLPAATPAPIDEQTARNALGLSQPTAVATLLPTPTAVPPTALPTNTGGPASGFLYEVQPNDTWQSIATIFGLSVDDLRQVNESTPGQPQPGTLVFIPRVS